MKVKVYNQPQIVQIATTVAVIGGIYRGIKKNYGVGKTALLAIGLGIAANVVSNYLYNKQKNAS